MPHTHITFIFLLLLYTASAHAQGIDTALAKIKRIHSAPASIGKDSMLAFQYNYLAEAYSGQKDSLAALYIDSLTFLKAHSLWPKTEGMLLRARGKYHDRRGEFEKALEYYSQAIDAFKKAGDQSEFIVYTYILKAFVLGNNGLFPECEKTLNEIRPLAERLDNKNYLAWIIDWFGDRSFYSSFGQQDFQKALAYYLQVEALLPQVRNTMIKADNAHCLAGCYLRLGDEAKAKYYTQLALDTAKAHQLHSVIFAVYSDQADVYESKKQFSQAIAYRLLSLEYARQTNWIEMEARAERNAAYTYKAAGDFQNALLHFEQLKTMEDSLARFDVQNKYHELEVKYETGKKDLEIKRLEARNLWIYLYVAALLLAGGILFVLYYRKTNRKLIAHNQELYQKNIEIQKALTEGQNIERKRMAIELHDNINAKIAAAKWVLETINTPEKPESEKQVIERLVESMSDIYEDVRFISHNLVPKELETKSLGEIVRGLVDNLNQNQKISFSCKVEGEEAALDPGLKLHGYAMIMELVNNIIKHSGCQHALLTLNYLPDALKIRVEDDGKGFDAESVKTGTGLKNLSTRVNSINGKLTFSPTGSSGTGIEILIPLDSIHVPG